MEDSIKHLLFESALARSHTIQTMKEVDTNLNFDSLISIQPNFIYYLDFLLNGVKSPLCEWFDDDVYYIEAHLLPLQDLQNYEICDIRKLIKYKFISIKDFDIFFLAEKRKTHLLKAFLPFFEDINIQDFRGRT